MNSRQPTRRPNHAPLTIGEQFGTLDALRPRRIDFGLLA
jgi:alkanesulfonate monooxygenase SsuD/methylene tetrahydromethanopterin reductase-like flavin-dependent oxidoreductase (luciferase family)